MIRGKLEALVAVFRTMGVDGIRISERSNGRLDVDVTCYSDDLKMRRLVTELGSSEPVACTHAGITWLASDVDLADLTIHITGGHRSLAA